MKKVLSKMKSKKIYTIVLVAAFAFIGTYILTFSEAATANAVYSLTPSTGSYNIGSDVSFEIYENSSTQGVSTVDVKLSYDATKLDFVSVDSTGGAFTNCFENSGGSGSVSLVCAKLGGSLTGSQKIGNVKFKAKVGTGSTAIQFSTQSKIFTAASPPEDVWNKVQTGATINFLTPDTTKPTVSFASPSNGATATGPLNITATAQDEATGISKVEFYVNNALVNTDNASPYTYTWDSTSLSDRTGLPIEIRAYDGATPTPNIGTASITIQVKNNKPNLNISSITMSPAEPRAGDQVTFTAQVRNDGTDNIASTTNISNLFKLNSVNLNNAVTIAGLNIGTTKPITTTWTATRGSHTIAAVADQNNTIVEVNESDNQLSKTFTVYKQADANNDNVVDSTDLAIFSQNWLKTGMTFLQGDFNGDGTINSSDLAILSSYWLK